MHRMLSNRLKALAGALVLLLATALQAQAPVPNDKAAPADNNWKIPVAAVLFAGFVIAVNIKSAKREHRD